ncbi:MAG TPA: MarR family transcriptional regulator [Longimicrobium sp.]|jgi:DNA-binding MarR family transcriptional regulator|uniref:MarR family winged helix-turn-helix transcriptional regulator n=1 Tax=Longimicrobium sp. TaxID=2029185 RepID=UPI002EDA2BE9
MPDHPIPPATRLWVSVARTYRHVSRRQARALAEMGLSVPQFDVLATLVRSPECGLRMGELSERLLVTEGNVTGLVSRLESAGLARRGPDPADARAVRVQLTEAGRARAQAAVPVVEAELDRAFGGLSEAEMRKVQRLLRRARREGP